LLATRLITRVFGHLLPFAAGFRLVSKERACRPSHEELGEMQH
jgi:hypothetical protein